MFFLVCSSCGKLCQLLGFGKLWGCFLVHFVRGWFSRFNWWVGLGGWLGGVLSCLSSHYRGLDLQRMALTKLSILSNVLLEESRQI